MNELTAARMIDALTGLTANVADAMVRLEKLQRRSAKATTSEVDAFALQAMQGMLAGPLGSKWARSPEHLARYAYEAAVAMMLRTRELRGEPAPAVSSKTSRSPDQDEPTTAMLAHGAERASLRKQIDVAAVQLVRLQGQINMALAELGVVCRTEAGADKLRRILGSECSGKQEPRP